MSYSTQFFAPGTISTALARVHENWDVVKTRRFAHFWPFSWAITHSFWLRRRFQWLVTPSTRKLARRKNTSIWSFLTVIMGNRRRFLAPDTISTPSDPVYTKIGKWSELVDLVISGRFRGLWHMVFFGSEDYFNGS